MLDASHAAIVKGLLARGEKQHDIAAFFGVNGGRIAEIKTGARYPEVSPAQPRALPSASMVQSGYAAFVAWHALDAIEAAAATARARILALHPELGRRH